MNRRILIIIISTLLISISSCKKYEDGPLISLYTKESRLLGNWKFENVKLNEEDVTDNYSYQYMQINKSGTIYWNVSMSELLFGTWDFKNDKEQLEMYFFSNDEDSEDIQYLWNIKQLKYDDMKLELVSEDSVLSWKMGKFR